jgi:hypothetical protein
MHEALPESLARSHSMSDLPTLQATGLLVYSQLLEIRKTKPVYVLASHSHFVMEGIFDTAYWRDHGGILPGWIIGTGGAVRYALPPDTAQAKLAKTHVYGYLLATVSAPGADDQNPIHFEFQEVAEAAAPTGSGATADKQSDRISPLGDGRRMRVPSAIVASTSIYDAGGRIRTRIGACESGVPTRFRQS